MGMTTTRKIVLYILVLLAAIVFGLTNPHFTDTAGSKASTNPVATAQANITYSIAVQVDKVATALANSDNKPTSAFYNSSVTYEQEAIIQIQPLHSFELYKVNNHTYRLQSLTWQTQACIHVSRQVGKLGTVTKGEC